MNNLVERLRKWATLKTGDATPNNWAVELSQLLTEAGDEIERLQRLAGAVSSGETFQELRKESKS